MNENDLWERLCDEDALRCGWHLARVDMKTDFIEELYSKDTFGHFDDQNIQEILRLLKSGGYSPNPLARVPIPKGILATRPGTLLTVEDRTILFAALKLIAKTIDSKLIDEVYSYRVKKGDSRETLFNESDVIAMPFLKHKTVQKYIDPFDPWYGLWPKFDEISRKAFEEGDYRYMATSDIAAYFENIQLDILRDQLHHLLPNEQKIINLFITAFRSWTYDTVQGRRYARGIPQGNQISSFFGNIFLKPIDDAFMEFKKDRDIKYYRYMDDIRIFTKEYKDARASILLLDTEIRRLHLNLQSAKTKIYDESFGEITAALIDRRLSQLEEISKCIRQVCKDAKKVNKKPDFSPIRKKLKRVAKELPPKSDGEQKIWRARRPLSGLSDRVFRRLITLHLAIGSDEILDRLVSEMKKNPDYRLGLKLVQFVKRFPRKKSPQTRLMQFLKSEENIFPYQEAQILKALRYQSRVHSDTIAHAKKRAKDEDVDYFVRMEAFRLLARCKLDTPIIGMAKDVFTKTQSINVKKSAALVLMRQRGTENTKFIQNIVLHSNDSIQKLGRFLRASKNDPKTAKYILDQALKEDFLLIDYLPILYLIIESKDKSLVKRAVKRIKASSANKNHINMDMRDRCAEVLNFAEQNLTSL